MVQSKFGNRHGTLNHFQHAVMIAIYCFFVNGFRSALHTLASRGLEELFLQLWWCVSFWFWQEIGFGFTYLCNLEYNTVVVLC